MQGFFALPSPAVAAQETAAPRMSVEAELCARALGGDGHAFRALVEPHLGMLYRVAARAARGDGALAEDAVQETLTLAFQQLGRYTPDTSFKSFLAAIAVRRALTLRRAEGRRVQREEQAEPPAGTESPEALSAARATAERVTEALAQLPKKRREAALLRLDAGLGYAEIARLIGSTEGSARVLVHLALTELRAKLADLLPATPGGSP